MPNEIRRLLTRLKAPPLQDDVLSGGPGKDFCDPPPDGAAPTELKRFTFQKVNHSHDLFR